MNYPIDMEKYIAAMRAEFGPNEAAEKAHREIIPLVNAAYMAGRNGEGGYPLDLEQWVTAYAQHSGRGVSELMENPLIRLMADWINRAYESGIKQL